MIGKSDFQFGGKYRQYSARGFSQAKTRGVLVKVSSLILSAAALMMAPASAQVPRPAHVIVVIMENHAYTQIIDPTLSPYLDQLAMDSDGAVFTQSFALTHPSQPNYLMLFSGSNQGITDDNLPATLPFTAPNLAANLAAKGFSYRAYSEDLPSIGFAGVSSGNYVRRHCPWVNWQGSGVNGIPASSLLPFTDFPTGYDTLPDVSFVIPNLQDDMHDGTVAQGDTWIKNHLDAYIQWTKSHNGLFVLTYDEDDDDGGNNRIPTIFVGQMVKGGSYSEVINHYNVLRTLEDMYGLPPVGASDTATPITDIWKTSTAVNSGPPAAGAGLWLVGHTVPAMDEVVFSFNIIRGIKASLEIHNTNGTLVHKAVLVSGQRSAAWETTGLPKGAVYFATLRTASKSVTRKILLSK